MSSLPPLRALMKTISSRNAPGRMKRFFLNHGRGDRAALGWTEAMTRLSEGHTHESAYEALKAEFTDEEQVKLTLMINVINGYNRLAVGFGAWTDPAAVKSAAKAAAA